MKYRRIISEIGAHSVGLNTPTASTSTTVANVVRHGNSSATLAQFHSHCVSVIHVNRLTDYYMYNGP